MKILLVYPPYVSPWMPYASLPMLTAYLKQQRVAEVGVWDASLDFFEYCTSPEAWPSKPEGEGGRSVDWQAIADAKARFRQPELFPGDDASLLQAFRTIETAMEAATRQFASTELHFFNPQYAPPRPTELIFPYGLCVVRCEMPYNPVSSEEVWAACTDASANPFMRFYEQEFLPRLEAMKPDVVGLSMAFPGQHIPTFTLARLVKMVSPQTHLALGGAQTSKLGVAMRRSVAFQNLLLPLFDSVILGEGEPTLTQLLRTLEAGEDRTQVKNLIFRRGHATVMTGPSKPADLSALPTPDPTELPLQRYLNHGSRPSLPLQATRGCYWGKCAFCDSSVLLGSYRTRPAAKVIADIVQVYEQHGICGMPFVDEALPPGLMRQLSEFLAESRLPVAWSTYARFDKFLTPQFCRQMAEGGCRVLFLGLEAASPRVSRLMSKGVDSSHAAHVLQALHDAGVRAHVFSIIGFPGETREEAMQTFEFLMEHRDLYQTYTLTPFIFEKNSPLAHHPERFALARFADDPHYDLTTNYAYEPVEGLTMEDTVELYHDFNRRLAEAGAYNPTLE